MRKVTYTIYLLHDTKGNRASVVANDDHTVIGPIINLMGKDGTRLPQFHGEAKDIVKHYKGHKVTINRIAREEDFDDLLDLPLGESDHHYLRD